MLDRRSFLAAGAAGLGSALATAAPAEVRRSLEHAGHAAGSAQLPALQVLTPEQAADVEAITSQIIPTDDVPGAREARVVYFIDHSLATWAQGQRGPTLNGLAEFNVLVSQRHAGKRFSQLTAAEQLEFLRANQDHPFFQQLIPTTRIGTFANPANGGNFEGAGWRAIGFEPRFLWEPPFGDYDAEVHGRSGT
jgi:gluconate 2-dehydrogenase gamma chain